MIFLAEAVWTPSLIVAGAISGVMLLAKLFPWLKGRNGNGNGEARGEAKRAIADLEREVARQDKANEDQWSDINKNRETIASIKATVDGIDRTTKELRDDIKMLVQRDYSGRGNDQ